MTDREPAARGAAAGVGVAFLAFDDEAVEEKAARRCRSRSARTRPGT